MPAAAPTPLSEESRPSARASSSSRSYGPSLPGRPPASTPPRLTLRPRLGSIGRDLRAGVREFLPTPSLAPRPAPVSLQHGIYAVGSEGPFRPLLPVRGSPPKATASTPPSKMPPPAPSAMALISGAGSSYSYPIKMKKQKTQDRLSADASSPSDESEDGSFRGSSATMGGRKGPHVASDASPPGAAPTLFSPSRMVEDSDPTLWGRGPPPAAPATLPPPFCPSVASTSSHGKRSLPEDDGNAGHAGLSSPFTPRGRQMMQNLSLHSPSPVLSLSPEQTARARPAPTRQQLPSAMTFSFSPSLKLEESGRALPSAAARLRPRGHSMDARGTIVHSPARTPLGTPLRGHPCPSTVASSSSSPFLSLLGQRAPTGHRGAFKTLRHLYPNGRDDASSSSLSGTCANTLTDSSHFSSSPFETRGYDSLEPHIGGIPRIVPLTVLSRDGSPLKTPKTNMPGLYLPSPSIRLLDQEEVKEEQEQADSVFPDSDVRMPNVLSVRASQESNPSHRLLPRIKLTPRSKDSFLLAKLSPSPEGDVAMPRLMQRFGGPLQHRQTFVPPEEEPRSSVNAASSLLTESPGAKVAAEMDSLLKGFGNHAAADDGEEPNREPKDEYTLDRVESEDAEMVALTQRPIFQMPSLWLSPSAATQENREGHRSASMFSDGDLTHFSPSNHKPAPSVNFNLGGSGQGAHSRNVSDTSPSFLPRQEVLPVPQTNPYSFTESSTNDRDPVERIIRAYTIAEAARSEEPLTDHDASNINGDGVDLLLRLPRKKQANEIHSKITTKNYPTKASQVGFLAEAPSHSSFTLSRSGIFSKRCASSPASPAPTVFEEGSPTIETFDPIGTQEGDLHGLKKSETPDKTFTTFSSIYDLSDIMASPKPSRTKASCATKDRLSVSSMMSTSSLCGLDIVHEASLVNQGSTKVPVLSQSKCSEHPTSTGMFRPLRSELSLNSLGLSVDSTDAGPHQRELMSPLTAGLRTNKNISPRDLCTPPVVGGVQTSRQMLSPPPLRCRAVWH